MAIIVIPEAGIQFENFTIPCGHLLQDVVEVYNADSKEWMYLTKFRDKLIAVSKNQVRIST